MWQYADNGRVSGITENVVDRDRWYGDFPAPSAGNLPRTSDGTGVTYQTHIQNIGWESFNDAHTEHRLGVLQQMQWGDVRNRGAVSSSGGNPYRYYRKP